MKSMTHFSEEIFRISEENEENEEDENISYPKVKLPERLRMGLKCILCLFENTGDVSSCRYLFYMFFVNRHRMKSMQWVLLILTKISLLNAILYNTIFGIAYEQYINNISQYIFNTMNVPVIQIPGICLQRYFKIYRIKMLFQK